jgi:hypothetical protein
MPTVEAIVGNKIVPGLGDRYLAAYGYSAQQTTELEEPDRPDNLWQPVDETRDFGAHGRFDAIARRTSWEAQASHHRAAIAAAVLVLGGLAALLINFDVRR